MIELHIRKGNSRVADFLMPLTAMSPSELQIQASAAVRPSILWQMNLRLTPIARGIMINLQHEG